MCVCVVCVLFFGTCFSCFDFRCFLKITQTYLFEMVWSGKKSPQKQTYSDWSMKHAADFDHEQKTMLFWENDQHLLQLQSPKKTSFEKKTTGQLLAAPTRVCVFNTPKVERLEPEVMMVSKVGISKLPGVDFQVSVLNFRGVTHFHLLQKTIRWSRVTVLILVGQWSQMVLTDERDSQENSS